MNMQITPLISVRGFVNVNVHTFVAPYDMAANATHIIETEESLVLVDTHFLKPLAEAFKAYALSLKKPIDRIFISHAHPDHYFGLASAFNEYPAYTLPEVRQIIAASGPQMIKNQKPMFGDLIPADVVLPKHTVSPDSTEVIGGLTYRFEKINGAESEAQLVIKLPQLGVIIAQDLVYSGVHLWLGMGWFDTWINELEHLAESTQYDYILAGHGLPCSKAEVIDCINYLQTSKELFTANLSPEEFKSQLITRFPERKSEIMFDLYLGFLFGTMTGHQGRS